MNGISVDAFNAMLNGNSEVILFTVQQFLSSCQFEDLSFDVLDSDTPDAVLIQYEIDISCSSNEATVEYNCIKNAISDMSNVFLDRCEKNKDLTVFPNAFTAPGSITSSNIVSISSLNAIDDITEADLIGNEIVQKLKKE